jgi:oligopeptide transport system permease protein
MVSFVLRRLLSALPTIFIVVTVSFFMIRVAPGGPFDGESHIDARILENLNRVYQLDQPLIWQYWSFLKNLAHGDMGPSFFFKDFTVAQLFAVSLPISMQNGGAALALALVVGVTLGSVAAVRQNQGVDHAVIGVATFGVTVPNFVVGPVLTLIFALGLSWLPAGGWNNGAFSHRVLPVVTLALPQMAVIARLTRAALIEALRANHIRTLRSLGLPGHTVVLHALRSAMLPVVSYLGPAAANLMTGSVVVERIFGIPGVGRYFVEGALSRDYTLVMGTVILIAVFVILFNLIVDLLYVALDPRVRME